MENFRASLPNWTGSYPQYIPRTASWLLMPRTNLLISKLSPGLWLFFCSNVGNYKADLRPRWKACPMCCLKGKRPAYLRFGPDSTKMSQCLHLPPTKMSICLKSCLDIFLACLFLLRQGLSDCLPAASFNFASIEINVCRPRLCDGSKITQCVSHLTSALFEHWSSSSTVCICQALAMHLFPYFTPSTPCLWMYSDRWRAKQGWYRNVMAWQSVKCKFAKEVFFFASRV